MISYGFKYDIALFKYLKLVVYDFGAWKNKFKIKKKSFYYIGYRSSIGLLQDKYISNNC